MSTSANPNKLPTAVVMMGKPGSGKSTQAKEVASRFGYRLYSTGGEFREMATADTSVGKKVRSMIDAGMLMPSWLASYLFQKQLMALTDGDRIVFEGVGRQLGEAKLFHEIMEFMGWSYRVYYLDLSDEVATERLVGRDERADDTATTIVRRLQKYHEFTDPAVEFFRSTGNVTEIDGTQAVDDIAASIAGSIAGSLDALTASASE